jgi:hypothetical protein
MGFRFHRRFPLGKLLRLNVSKSGVSLGVGPPGANINISNQGVRSTIGAPGTGLSYQDRRSWGRGVSPLAVVVVLAVIVIAAVAVFR